MPVYENPLVDEENPLYCPSVSAVAYLQSIRSQTHSESKRRKQPSGKPQYNSSSRILDDQLLQSFTSVLDRSLDEHDLAELLFAYNRTGGEPIESSGSSAGSLSTLSFWSQQKVACETRKTKGMDSSSVSRRSEVHVSSGFNDLQGSSRRGKSSVSINDHSFDLSAKADRLRYFAQNFGNSPYDGRLHQNGGNGYQYQISGTNSLKRKIRNLEDELYGPSIGTETPRGLDRFISSLVNLLPGIRLRERLKTLGISDHQQIADFLATEGKLNSRILNLFRTSEIETLDLAASMKEDQEGLNLDARDLLCVFSKPNGFFFLNELNLSNVGLKDQDMMHIQRLPRLSRLWMSNTGIGNEALFLLVPLKRTLAELDIAFNPSIDDDAIPVLILLQKLQFLTILGTGIRMPGLRRLAQVLHDRQSRIQHKTEEDEFKEKEIELEIPRDCDIYLDRMCEEYHEQTADPTLVLSPSSIPSLPTETLKRNLETHIAAYADSGQASCVDIEEYDVSTEGTKEELARRLERILEVRRMDMVAWDVVNGYCTEY